MAALGSQSEIPATKRSPAMPGMIVAFACVVFLMADLDRPHEGYLMVSQEAMIDLQKSMGQAK
jgi:hypothetical protein